MFEHIVLNASPLIVLGKADLLTTISPLAKIWLIPEGVVQEIEVNDQLMLSFPILLRTRRPFEKLLLPSILWLQPGISDRGKVKC